MESRVYISGRIVPPEEATISVLDRGFLYGDSIYEVVRVYGGVPFALEPHLERLAASGERMSTRPASRASRRAASR